MEQEHILAVVQSDLQYICALRQILELRGFGSVSIARNSEEALLYLRGVGIYADRSKYPIPSAIILDSENRDHADLDVLAWAREREAYRHTPMVMLCDAEPILTHASCAIDENCFLVDRRDLHELASILQTLENRPIPGSFESRLSESSSLPLMERPSHPIFAR